MKLAIIKAASEELDEVQIGGFSAPFSDPFGFIYGKLIQQNQDFNDQLKTLCKTRIGETLNEESEGDH